MTRPMTRTVSVDLEVEKWDDGWALRVLIPKPGTPYILIPFGESEMFKRKADAIARLNELTYVPQMCKMCSIHPADPPGKLCVSCRDHTGHF